MTLTVPLEAAPASPIMGVPSMALLILAVIALAFASIAQSVEQAIQRLTLAGVEDSSRKNTGTRAPSTASSITVGAPCCRCAPSVPSGRSSTPSRAPSSWWTRACLVGDRPHRGVRHRSDPADLRLLPARPVGRAQPRGIALGGTGLADRLARLSHVADPLLTRLRSSRPAPEPTEAQARAELISDLREIVDEVGEPESSRKRTATWSAPS